MADAFLIGYDINEPRRLQRIYHGMIQRAMPVEYTIFLFVGDERGARSCMDAVANLMDAETDDVRCYPLPAREFQARIGKAALPEDIQWAGLPSRLG